MQKIQGDSLNMDRTKAGNRFTLMYVPQFSQIKSNVCAFDGDSGGHDRLVHSAGKDAMK